MRAARFDAETNELVVKDVRRPVPGPASLGDAVEAVRRLDAKSGDPIRIVVQRERRAAPRRSASRNPLSRSSSASDRLTT